MPKHVSIIRAINRKKIIAAFFVILTMAGRTALCTAESTGGGPLIQNLDATNTMFAQYLLDVEEARKRISRLGNAVGSDTLDQVVAALTVYTYKTKKNDELIAIAARCGVPYETIATANRIESSQPIGEGRIILLPSIPGVFVPEQPVSDLERLMRASRADSDGKAVVLRNGEHVDRFKFIPGAEFTGTERAFFLNAAFRFPLPRGRLTSAFGMRDNPVTGVHRFHAGIDLAAPVGTDVYATRAGVVVDTGMDLILGRYIVIAHTDGWRSVYGHLSAILVDLRKTIRSGTIIGKVGTTGQSTGPHLHFELRKDGEARNPASLLPRGMER